MTLPAPTQDKLRGMLLGLAVGDAMGMSAEFQSPGTFAPITGYRAGGPFALPAGYWTDDTSMALCLADSLIAKQGYDSYDVMERYYRWWRDGYRSSTGRCFDIGVQTANAIVAFERRAAVPRSTPRTTQTGNGAIMRLAPVVIAALAAGDSLADCWRLATLSARDTHFSHGAEQTTGYFGAMLYRAATGVSKDSLAAVAAGCLAPEVPGSERFPPVAVHPRITQAGRLQPDAVKNSGFIVDTLEAATWALQRTNSFADGLLAAVNLGGDADTIGAVYGQLAGAYYGLAAIPSEWIAGLHDHDELLATTDHLITVFTGVRQGDSTPNGPRVALKRSRFEEDTPVPRD